MSLLLDALKKSVDDKVKSTDDDTNHDIALDLDLNLADEGEYTQANEKVHSNKKTSSIEALLENKLEDKTHHYEWEASMQNGGKVPDKAYLENTANDDISPSKSEYVLGIEPARSSSNSSLENKQTLSALISKSNQISRREKLKKNTGLAIFVTFVIIVMGLYIYIEIQVENQSIYSSKITQKNAPEELINISSIRNLAVVPVKTEPVFTSNNAVNNALSLTHKVLKPVKEKFIAQHKNKPEKTSTDLKDTKPGIHIIHTQKTDPIHILLNEAYALFHHQNYAQSEKIYKSVLARKPVNRDALFGLAAIATKEKRYEFARQKYQYLVQLNPKDSLAVAGLSAIEHHINIPHDESRLKFMIKQQPDSAHLYFALGTQYSAQKKWAEAQSAYFSAWSAENKNADYCYNLAVSLDHLDKKEQALDFYNLSLKLKLTSNGNFSQVDVENRIHALQGKSNDI